MQINGYSEGLNVRPGVNILITVHCSVISLSVVIKVTTVEAKISSASQCDFLSLSL